MITITVIVKMLIMITSYPPNNTSNKKLLSRRLPRSEFLRKGERVEIRGLHGELSTARKS